MHQFGSRHRKRVVIAGGGVAGLEALLALCRRGAGSLDVTLVNPLDTFSFRAMGVEEPFKPRAVHPWHLGDIAADVDATFVQDGVQRVDAAGGHLELHSGARLPYDALLMATGARSYPAFTHGITFDRERERRSFDDLLVDVAAGAASSVAVVVPDGVGWTMPAYELALSLSTLGREGHRGGVHVTLVTYEQYPVAAFGASASRVVRRVLADAGIDLMLGIEPVLVHDEALVAGTRWLTADRIVALPRLAGSRPRGVPCDEQGFVMVDEYGAVRGLRGVYAAGDGTSHPIKQGGLAAQQAGAVVDHLLWTLGMAPPPTPPSPVLRGVLNTPKGRLHLEAALNGGRAGEGSRTSWQQLWPAPGRVASRWLSSYLDATPASVAA